MKSVRRNDEDRGGPAEDDVCNEGGWHRRKKKPCSFRGISRYDIKVLVIC